MPVQDSGPRNREGSSGQFQHLGPHPRGVCSLIHSTNPQGALPRVHCPELGCRFCREGGAWLGRPGLRSCTPGGTNGRTARPRPSGHQRLPSRETGGGGGGRRAILTCASVSLLESGRSCSGSLERWLGAPVPPPPACRPVPVQIPGAVAGLLCFRQVLPEPWPVCLHFLGSKSEEVRLTEGGLTQSSGPGFGGRLAPPITHPLTKPGQPPQKCRSRPSVSSPSSHKPPKVVTDTLIF